MKRNLLPILLVLGVAGCARFSTRQVDLSYGTDGKPSRQITTRASATTFFEAKSALASFKASQTDKTQSATVGGLNQESTASNAVRIAEAVTEAAIRAATKP